MIKNLLNLAKENNIELEIRKEREKTTSIETYNDRVNEYEAHDITTYSIKAIYNGKTIKIETENINNSNKIINIIKEQSKIIDNNDKYDENIKQYKEYQTNNEISLKDGSEWIVIKNSPKESDYVTLIAKDPKDITNSETYNLLYKEIFETKPNYNNSELKKYVESLANNIPINLKEVDGYKIRLITVDEILELDNNWKYDEENDSYTYTGNNYENIIFVGLTMTETKHKGRHIAFYSQTHDVMQKKYYLSDYALGVPQIKPVINVYKREIDN